MAVYVLEEDAKPPNLNLASTSTSAARGIVRRSTPSRQLGWPTKLRDTTVITVITDTERARSGRGGRPLLGAWESSHGVTEHAWSHAGNSGS